MDGEEQEEFGQLIGAVATEQGRRVYAEEYLNRLVPAYRVTMETGEHPSADTLREFWNAIYERTETVLDEKVLSTLSGNGLSLWTVAERAWATNPPEMDQWYSALESAMMNPNDVGELEKIVRE